MAELDRFILQTLQEDGRTPFTQIARRAGVSETTIRSRYRHLVETGIVRAVGLVDPHALGFQAPAIVGVSVEPGAIDRVARMIAEFPEVSYLVMALGPFDLVVEVFCRDLPHLSDLVTQQIHLIPGVRSTETPTQIALHMVLPIFSMSVMSIAGYSRYTRSQMLEVISGDYLQT